MNQNRAWNIQKRFLILSLRDLQANYNQTVEGLEEEQDLKDAIQIKLNQALQQVYFLSSLSLLPFSPPFLSSLSLLPFSPPFLSSLFLLPFSPPFSIPPLPTFTASTSSISCQY